MEQFRIDNKSLGKYILIILIIYSFKNIYNIIFGDEKFYILSLISWISIIIVAWISVTYIKEIFKKIDPPNPICGGYLDNLNELEDHKIKLLKEGEITEIGETDDELREAAMATHNEIIIIERSYACACDGDDSNLPMEDRPSNKKSQWKNIKTNKIEEMTYKEYFTGMCDNNCKSENRPLTRCSATDDCKFPGEICYQHPYLIENASENGVSPPRGVCISNIKLSNLESMVDIYNSTFCELDTNSSIDYSCATIVAGAVAADFRGTKKDIVNYTLAPDDDFICYSPFEELRGISDYDEDNQKYIMAASGGDKCCVPIPESSQTDTRVSQIDKISSFLKSSGIDVLEGIGTILLQDLFQVFVEEGLKTSWDLVKLGVKGAAEKYEVEAAEAGGKAVAKHFGESLFTKSLAGKAARGSLRTLKAAPGKIGRTVLKSLLEAKPMIMGGFKMALKGIKGMFELVMDAKNLSLAALDLSKVMAQLLSKLVDGAKNFYELGKTSLAAGKGGFNAAKIGMENLGRKISEGAAERAAAAMATKAAIAEVAAKEGTTMAAKATASALFDALPGIGTTLFAIQLIGMVMDEADTGGFQNIVKNSDVIDKNSEQLEGAVVWMFRKQLKKSPPFTINMVNTFFPPDKKDEGSKWPFNFDLIMDKADKTNAQNLHKLISLQKEATEKHIESKLTEQVYNYIDTIKDPDIAKTLMIELHDHVNNENLTEKGRKDKIHDYFLESISSLLKYELTKEECEKRDQDIYDRMINESGFTDNEKKKYINNTGRKFYYNKDALVYLNKELSSKEYSGIICTPKAIDLYNRYRNLREGQQYIAYSEFYLDISYSEADHDHPNNLKHHMEKKNIKDSETIKNLDLSLNNPIFMRYELPNDKILGLPQYTQMNDIEAICLYGGMTGKPNYPRPGIHGMLMADAHGTNLSKTWLKGGDAPTAKQPFGPPGCIGANCCQEECNENYNKDGLQDSQAKMRKNNYYNRIMSWNYADKSDWYNNNGAWGNSTNTSPERMKTPAAMLGANRELDCLGCGKGTNSPHAKVIDDDNRICIITRNYCQDEGLDIVRNNRYGGQSPLNEGDYNNFDLTYGNNYREYDDCDEGYAHEVFSWILGDSMSDEIARWL